MQNIVKIEDLTSNVVMDPSTFEVTGDGVFDKIMATLNTHMLAQYKAQRLKAENFATVYVGVVPTVLQESIKFLLQKESSAKDLDLKQAQIDKLNDDKLTSAKQRDLYQRQIKGFDDNKLQKLFESQVSSWGLMFSSGMLTEKPAFITGTQVTDLYNKLITGS